jgi:hypothetical protein
LADVATWASTLKEHGAEDAAWDWTALLRTFKEHEREGFGKYEFYALRCQRQAQALMILKIANHVSQITGDPLVYVEFIAVAPWNRPAIQEPRRFKRCGSVLLELAAERSRLLGFSGRLGLHSKPASRAFYRNSGLKDFGPDPQEGGLHYFELQG